MIKKLALDEYQEKAMTTCVDSSENISYMAMNLIAEVGEMAGKIAKAIRKEQVSIADNKLTYHFDSEFEKEQWEEALKKECGDCLWQLSGVASVMGWKLSHIAQQNLDKLASRKQLNTIIGEGDNR